MQTRQHDGTLALVNTIEFITARDRYRAALNFAATRISASSAHRTVAMGAVERTARDFRIAAAGYLLDPATVSDPRD